MLLLDANEPGLGCKHAIKRVEMELAIRLPERKAWLMEHEEGLKSTSNEFEFFIAASPITSSQFCLQIQLTKLGLAMHTA